MLDLGAFAQDRSESTYSSIGGVSVQTTTAKGFGQSPREAVMDALQTAVAQVNGLRLRFEVAGFQLQGEVAGVDGTSAYFSTDVFANAVIAASEGTVKSFKILNLEENFVPLMMLNAGNNTEKWTADVSVDFQAFRQSANSGLPRIIIAPLQGSQASYRLGDRSVSFDSLEQMVSKSLRDKISEVNNFVLLDRDKTSLIDDEFDFIQSGRANKAEFARIGQMLAADLVLIPTINRMAYSKNVRNLKTSDRPLVSYSGGMDISLEIINIASGAVEYSDTYSTSFPSTEPTTLSRGLDGRPAAQKALNKGIDAFFDGFVSTSSPIRIVQLNGNMAVLNAGDSRVKSGSVFDVYSLGDEVFDPQTNVSLGRVEFPVGTLKITRVAEKLSYGVLSLDDGLTTAEVSSNDLTLRSPE